MLFKRITHLRNTHFFLGKGGTEYVGSGIVYGTGHFAQAWSWVKETGK